MTMEDNCEDSIAGLILDEVVTIDVILLLVDNKDIFLILLEEEDGDDSISKLLLEDVMFMVAIILLLGNEEVWLLLLEEDNNVDSCLLVFLTIDDE